MKKTFTASRRLGYHFGQSQLYITTAQDEMRLDAWPLMKATRRRWDKSRGCDFVPAFRLLYPKDVMLPIMPGPEPLLEKYQAFHLFRQSLPPRLALAVERFRAHQWAVLRMVQEREEAIELVEQNPVLGFCAANLAKFRRVSGNQGRQAAELSRRPQREILGRLGFPDSQAWVNLVRKILPETISVVKALELREVSKSEDVTKLLAHVPVLNSLVFRLARYEPRLLRLISPALLAEVSAAGEDCTSVLLLGEMESMLRSMNELHRLRNIRTITALRELHIEVEVAYQRHMGGLDEVFLKLRFPPPPIPGTLEIVPLTQPIQLLEEGRQQHHCVACYGERVAAGKVFIYSVLKPERATLSVHPAAGGEWKVEQLLLACNQPVSPATMRAVHRWLAKESVSV